MDLNRKVAEIKRQTFEMVMRAKKGHLGGSLSCLECLVALYYGGLLRYNPKNPKWENRDRFVLSKGHANNGLYVILADVGFYASEELHNFCQNGSFLGGHSDEITPGIDVSTGSLGHGLGLAAGMALGFKMDRRLNKVYCVIGDGESQEGSIWEAAMFASHHKLDNLIVYLDRNKLGSEDFTENTIGLEPVDERWKSFGWSVVSISGHDPYQFVNLSVPLETKPLLVISHTVKGKGLAHENTPKSHHTLPKGDQIELTRSNLA